ncbi:MAG TPA: peptide-methionine (S)-S-oxide reductase MsrA [Alphaproteobacteria bacterium]|nr:peptide-methionine (S)-S-oxide reductase MsrA [Alphaproteobacteria bacterium]
MLKTVLAAAALAAAAFASAAPAQTGAPDKLKTAIFAGGCFWCVEEVFDKVDGVVETVSGYTGGILPNPTYEQVSANTTGHAEAVRVKYDPARVSYVQLLEAFWHNVDPFDAGGQFCDRGSSYRSAIFVMDDEEEKLAKDSKAKVATQFNRSVATEIVRATPFYPAEGYHQDYYTKNPLRYTFYKWNCGRAQRLEEIWGKKQASGAQ